MSDAEMPPAAEFGGSDSGSDAYPGETSDALPEGIEKTVISEASEDNYKMPKKGDEVTVHYVGTLQSDGSQFDSSRDRGTPFNFTLGTGQVIKGWDLGVATMKKGEIAKFVFAPEFAYGDAGSPPKIPEKATLVFEVELISWESKDDLFGDEGVIKTLVEEGSGWKSPKMGDEIIMSLKAVAKDGAVIEDKTSFEYTIGSDSLGPVAKACDKALQGMKKGETASLICTKEYAYGDKTPDGVSITVSLEQIIELKDVSVEQNKSMMKRQVQEGEGWDMPKDCSSVKLNVTAATNGTSVIAEFKPQVLEFKAGNGEVCDALEFTVAQMKKGEKAMLTVTGASVSAARDNKLGLNDFCGDKLIFNVELVDFEKCKDTWSMSEDEKIKFGTDRKEVGSALLKSGRLSMALQRYKKVTELFGYTDNIKDECNKEKARALKQACELNKAMVHLKQLDYAEAKSACDAVLKEDRSNVKGLYRRAQAELGLKNFSECMNACKKVVEIEPQNKEARALLKQAQAGQREEDKKAKGLFSNMCKALGKGPIPEPYKTKESIREDMSEDDEEDAVMDCAEMPGEEDSKPSRDH